MIFWKFKYVNTRVFETYRASNFAKQRYNQIFDVYVFFVVVRNCWFDWLNIFWCCFFKQHCFCILSTINIKHCMWFSFALMLTNINLKKKYNYVSTNCKINFKYFVTCRRWNKSIFVITFRNKKIKRYCYF